MSSFCEVFKEWIEMVNKIVNNENNEKVVNSETVLDGEIVRESLSFLKRSDNILKEFLENINKTIEEYNNSMNLYPCSIGLSFNDDIIYYLLNETEYNKVYISIYLYMYIIKIDKRKI